MSLLVCRNVGEKIHDCVIANVNVQYRNKYVIYILYMYTYNFFITRFYEDIAQRMFVTCYKRIKYTNTRTAIKIINL